MSGKKDSEKECAYCGTQAPSGALFCPHCGEPLDPSYVYDESVFSEDAAIKEEENLRVDEITFTPSPPTIIETRTPLMYEGMIRGRVTRGSIPTYTSILVAKYPNISSIVRPSTVNYSPHYASPKVCFVIRPEERFEGVPDEILVLSSKFGYFGEGDEVSLQGKIFKMDLSKWGRPMFTIVADNYYNETLQIDDKGIEGGNHVLYKGMIRGSVTKEQKTTLYGNYFVIRLEENTGIGGISDEILVRCRGWGYFGIGDKVILQGIITENVHTRLGRPSYTIRTNNFYNESLQISYERLMERREVLHKGIIRGSVTRESGNQNFLGIYFVVKLEEYFGEVPEGVLVKTPFGYFGMGDKVILQGRIIKANVRHWNRPMYLVIANHFYNESLQISDVGLADMKPVSYMATIQGTVTKESRIRILNKGGFFGTYFVMRLEGDIEMINSLGQTIRRQIEGIPPEILVRFERAGYFRIGDKVILRGSMLEANSRRWNKTMYLFNATSFYNESLQIGHERVLHRMYPIGPEW
jgi:hypothetical protein